MPAPRGLGNAVAMLFGLAAVGTTGLPIPSDVDHDGRQRHVEVGHGGHGAVLVPGDARLASRVSVHAVAITLPAPGWTEPPPRHETPVVARVVVHLSRDPPAAQPRAPPFTTS